MNKINKSLVNFFSVVGEWQAYVNIIYLLLAFPLGIFYFIFLVTGLAAGIPLTMIWIGIPILLLVLGGWWLLAAFERQMAIWLLKEDIVQTSPFNSDGEGVWARLKAHLTNQVTWKSLLFLFVKFPLGIFSFVVVVISVAFTIGFLSAPLLYKTFEWGIDIAPGIVWQIDTYDDALIAAMVGLLMWPVSLHVMGWVAKVSGKFAAFMLGNHYQTEVGNGAEI